VLGDLAKYLSENIARLSGIIFLHNILDTRMRYLSGMVTFRRLLKRLCDEDQVFLVSTMWDKVDRQEGDRREAAIKSLEFWQSMIRMGSQVHRHYNNRGSALAIIDLLLSRRGSIALGTSVLRAARGGDIDNLKACAREGANFAATKDAYGRTAIHFAAQAGHLEAVKYLLENSAELNAKDNLGMTALHFEAQAGRLEGVKYLVDKGAEVNAKDNDEMTALHFAAGGGYLETVEYLIEKGADTTATDTLGRQARDLVLLDELKKIFDKPPPVTRVELPALKNLQKPPISPWEENEKQLLGAYKALLYHYDTDTNTTQDARTSIHDLIYLDNDTKAESEKEENLLEKAGNRWIHLPANNVGSQTPRSVLANPYQ